MRSRPSPEIAAAITKEGYRERKGAAMCVLSWNFIQCFITGLLWNFLLCCMGQPLPPLAELIPQNQRTLKNNGYRWWEILNFEGEEWDVLRKSLLAHIAWNPFTAFHPNLVPENLPVFCLTKITHQGQPRGRLVCVRAKADYAPNAFSESPWAPSAQFTPSQFATEQGQNFLGMEILGGHWGSILNSPLIIPPPRLLLQ